MQFQRSFHATLLATALVALAGCATGPDVRTDYNPDIDFTQYQTFGWVDELGTDRAGYSTLTTDYFKRAVRNEMEALGYTYTERNPDLLVNFFTRIREETETYARSHPMHTLAPHPLYFHGAGYYGYRYGLYTAWPYYDFAYVDTVQYKVGTANVDVIDAEEKALIWEGVAEGRLTREELDNPGEAIADTVGDLFEKFPTRSND